MLNNKNEDPLKQFSYVMFSKWYDLWYVYVVWHMQAPSKTFCSREEVSITDLSCGNANVGNCPKSRNFVTGITNGGERAFFVFK